MSGHSGIAYIRFCFLMTLIVGLMGTTLSVDTIQQVRTQVVSGVREIVYTDPTPSETNPFVIEKGTVFGADQGADTYFLSRPFPRGLARDGSLFIIDVMQTEIHRFSKEGTHLSVFGNKGGGPGEFQVLQDLTVDGEHLYVNDPFSGRMNIFSLDGEIIEMIPLGPDRGPYMTLYGPSEARLFVLVERNRSGFRMIRLNEKMEKVDTPIDTIRSFPTVQLGGRDAVPPFVNTNPTFAIAPDMPVAWSYGEEFRVDFMDVVDLSRWAVTVPHEAPRVTQAMKESVYQRYERTNQVEEARRNLKFPSHLPHIASVSPQIASGMFWDSAGRLWVMEYRVPTEPDSPYRFYVFSKDGEWLFVQDLPKSPGMISGEGFYARGEDEEGNPVIEFYRFIRR